MSCSVYDSLISSHRLQDDFGRAGAGADRVWEEGLRGRTKHGPVHHRRWDGENFPRDLPSLLRKSVLLTQSEPWGGGRGENILQKMFQLFRLFWFHQRIHIIQQINKLDTLGQIISQFTHWECYPWSNFYKLSFNFFFVKIVMKYSSSWNLDRPHKKKKNFLLQQTFQLIVSKDPPFRHQTNRLYTPMTTMKHADPTGRLPLDAFYKLIFQYDRVFNASLGIMRLLQRRKRKFKVWNIIPGMTFTF